MQKKCLVTGGLGFIGSNLVDLLIEEGYDVYVIDDLSTGKAEYANPKANYKILDIRKYNEIKWHFQKMDYVFHMAALPRVEPSIINPLVSDEINTKGALNVFFAAKEAGVSKIIFSSSSSIYGDVPPRGITETELIKPLSPYAQQKLFGEQYLELFHTLYGQNSVSLRYFNVYGERQPDKGAYVPVVGIWFRQLLAGEPLTITGDGNNKRDFINVRDVARANLCAAQLESEGHQAFNIGSGKNQSLNELAASISSNTRYIDARLEPTYTLADCSKAHQQLQWSPEVDIDDWIKQNKPIVR